MNLQVFDETETVRKDLEMISPSKLRDYKAAVETG